MTEWLPVWWMTWETLKVTFKTEAAIFTHKKNKQFFSPHHQLLIAYNMSQLTEIKHSVKYSLHQLGNYNKTITSLEIMGHILSHVD